MLIAVCSVKGSPGVTTAAVALAMCWPGGERPVLVECDPAGGDLVARFRLEQVPGLVSLAAAARRSIDPGLVWQHTQQLPAGLSVVVGPVGAEQARGALAQLTDQRAMVLRAAADEPGTVVIADCGRADPDSLALTIIHAADAMLLLAHARDDQLAHVSRKLPIAGRWSRQPAFVLVGDGYGTDEVSEALGINIMGRIPHDPKAAAALGGHPSPGHTMSGSGMGRAVIRLAQLTGRYARVARPQPHPARAHLPAGNRTVQPDMPRTAPTESRNEVSP